MTVSAHNQQGALGVEAIGMTMRFGSFTALDNVSIEIPPGTFHALLGENGAGKSTLVKCMMGFYHATAGEMMVDGHQVEIRDPVDAHALGLGMVYQQFTLVPSLTAAENLLISREDAPVLINWKKELSGINDFMQRMPFSVPLQSTVNRLSAGEKQKLEILKQLYLGRKFLILDEPTSVLTPAEADEVLGLVRELCTSGQITAMMISHKFREVTAFADDVSVLRKGAYAGGGRVRDLTVEQMAQMMVGGELSEANLDRVDQTTDKTVLSISGAQCPDRSGLKHIHIENLAVRAGEIVGVAGVSGNGQVELMEILSGQRGLDAGTIEVQGDDFRATRSQEKQYGVRFLPEEPLFNACAPRMSVAENMALRNFDEDDAGNRLFWTRPGLMRRRAARLVEAFKVKTTSLEGPIEALSGGNVQRAVLSRELTGEVDLLIISNPCFGLDFSAVAEIRGRIMQARNKGTAVLLISEDLDEIMQLSDRVLVMSEGRIAFESPTAQASVEQIGQYMAGHA